MIELVETRQSGGGGRSSAHGALLAYIDALISKAVLGQTLTTEAGERGARVSEALAQLVPLGLRVAEADVRDMLGFAAPEDGDELLGTSPPPGADGSAKRRFPSS